MTSSSGHKSPRRRSSRCAILSSAAPTRSLSHPVLFLQPLNEQISRLHEELAAERLSREVMDERKTKEIKAVESSISLDLTAEKRVRTHPVAARRIE